MSLPQPQQNLYDLVSLRLSQLTDRPSVKLIRDLAWTIEEHLDVLHDVSEDGHARALDMVADSLERAFLPSEPTVE